MSGGVRRHARVRRDAAQPDTQRTSHSGRAPHLGLDSRAASPVLSPAPGSTLHRARRTRTPPQNTQHLLAGAAHEPGQLQGSPHTPSSRRRPTARARVVLQPRLARAAQEMSLGALENVAAMPVHAHGAVRQVFADRAGQFSELALFVGASRDPPRLGSGRRRGGAPGLGRIIVAVRQRTEYVRQHTAASASGSLSRAAF